MRFRPLYNPLRAAVDLARHFQPVPVRRRLFCQRVVNINGDGFFLCAVATPGQAIAVIALVVALYLPKAVLPD